MGGGSTMNSQSIQRMYKGANKMEPLLYVDDPFTIHDIDVDGFLHTLESLKRNGIVEVVGKEKKYVPHADSGQKPIYVNKYKLEDTYREAIREGLSGPKLPCGHRAHIHHKHSGGFGCKYCSEERDYSRDTVQRALNDTE